MEKTMRFDDRRIVITGAGRQGQLGESVAAAFIAAGGSVALIDRHERDVAPLTASGARAPSFVADLADPSGATAVAEQVRSTLGDRIDALVLLAGGFESSGPVASDDPMTWTRMLQANLLTAANATRAFLPLVRAARGAIVCVASDRALTGAKPGGIAAYAAAKSGVIALVRAVAAEEHPNGVRINAIAPGAIRTGANLASMGASVPYLSREEVADVILWLSSPRSRAVTGQVLELTAGLD